MMQPTDLRHLDDATARSDWNEVAKLASRLSAIEAERNAGNVVPNLTTGEQES